MKYADLKCCDIMVCDYSWLGRMNDVRYVIMMNPDGEKVAISYQGNCNDPKDGNYGWYQAEDEYEIPDDCIAIYRPKWFGKTFNNNLDDEDVYECIYRKK